MFLKEESFLKLCGVGGIDWEFNKSWLKKDSLELKSRNTWAFRFSCPLSCKTNHYGDMIFFSSRKFLQGKKQFLKKVAFLRPRLCTLLKIEKKMKNIKNQWSEVFDSFSQAFCITNKDFQIIRTNQSFQQISKTSSSDLFGKSFFEIFPVPKEILSQNSQGGSWLFKEKGLCWNISFKPLFLKKESTRAFLFLLKDVTREIEIEEQLSVQAKTRELGFIKGSIAHELNNPVAGIKGLLDVLEQSVPENQSFIRDSLKEMQKSVHTCQRIINKLLFVSKQSQSNPPA